MKTFHKICRIGFYVSLTLPILPFVLLWIGYGGDGFAQAGFVFVILALPIVMVFALLVVLTDR